MASQNDVLRASKKVSDKGYQDGMLSASTSTSTLTSSNTTPIVYNALEFPRAIDGYSNVNNVDAPSLTSSLLPRKRQVTQGDKLVRSRERNRMHARKTRERKKTQMNALQQRIEDLHAESKELRLKIDERYTASLLIGLTSNCYDMDDCKPAAMLCSDSYSNTNDWFRDETAIPYQKRVRSPGKHTQLERERFRRERNRMHAKRTRDRKKMFFEISEQVIAKMEAEAKILRNYLVSANMMTIEERDAREERDKIARISLMRLKNGGEVDGTNFATGIASNSFVDDDDDEDENDSDYDDCKDSEQNKSIHSVDNDQMIVDGVVIDNNVDEVDGDDVASNNGSSHGSISQDGSNGGTTSHESAGSSSSVSQTESGMDGDIRLGDDDSESNDLIDADADASFQVKDVNSANFVNKSTLEALKTSQTIKVFTG